MRFATIVEAGRSSVAVVRGQALLPLSMQDTGLSSLRAIAASGADGLRRVHEWVQRQPERAYRPSDDVEFGPAVPDPADLRLGCSINGLAIQAGRTAQMRFSVGEVIAYLSRHVGLRPGDLIATGTPARLAGPIGPERHLQAGDVVTVWIEHIGELTTTIA